MKKGLLCFMIIGFVFFMNTHAFSGVVWQDNFDSYKSEWVPSNSAAASYYYPNDGMSSLKNYEPSAYPADQRNNGNSWNGWIRYGDNTIEITENEGRNGSNCLKIGYAPGSHQQQVGLIKWLGMPGYKELYIKWYFKLDDDWQWGNGTNGSFVYHKVMRIWQGIDLENLEGKKPTALYDFPYGQTTLIWGDDNYNSFSPHVSAIFHWDRIEGESSDNNRQGLKWYNKTEGQLSTYTGELSGDGYFIDKQNWHSIQYHIKLRSKRDVADGIFEIWIDGVKLPVDDSIISTSTPKYNSYIPYIHSEDGKYMNWIVLMDNGDGGDYWNSKKYWYIDDFVISDEYIESDTETETVAPQKPQNLKIQ